MRKPGTKGAPTAKAFKKAAKTAKKRRKWCVPSATRSVLDRIAGYVLHRTGSNHRDVFIEPTINYTIYTMSPRKKKTYHEIDPEEAIQALSILKNDPHFKQYVMMREAMREEVIRQLQTPAIIDSTNRHYMLCGKLEAIDEELDTFYKL